MQPLASRELTEAPVLRCAPVALLSCIKPLEIPDARRRCHHGAELIQGPGFGAPCKVFFIVLT